MRKIILPGVGHYDYVMKKLRKSNLIDSLNEAVITNKNTNIRDMCW